MRLETEVARLPAGGLAMHYFATGKTGDLLMPPATVPARADALWEHTCFEAFLRASAGETYYEFNFAPSHRWAAYAFGGYRHGMRPATQIGTPRMDTRSYDSCFEMHVSLELDELPHLPAGAAWRLGLSAVIEETSGRKSYWALVHPPGRPDFHHADAFALELPPVGA